MPFYLAMIFATLLLILILAIGLSNVPNAVSHLNVIDAVEIPEPERTNVREVESRIAKLKMRGVPTDISTLDTCSSDLQASLSENAAWLRVFWHVSSDEFKSQCDGVYPFTQTQEPCGDVERMRQARFQRALLDRNAEFLANFHHLVAQSPSEPKYIVDESLPSQSYLTELSYLMSLLDCEMQVCIADRKPSRVLTCLQSQFNLLNVSPDNLSEFSFIHRVHSEVSTLANIKTALNANVLESTQIARLIDNVREFNDLSAYWQRMVDHQRAWAISMLQMEISFQRFKWGPDKVRAPVSNADLLNLLDSMERYENIDLSNWESTKNNLEFIEERLSNEIASDYVFDSLRLCAQSFVYTRSMRHHAILACALKLYQLQHGSYPESLNQLFNVGIDQAQYLCLGQMPFGYQRHGQTAYLWGPIQRFNLRHPFEFSMTIPTYTSTMLPEERKNIDEALWRLES